MSSDRPALPPAGAAREPREFRPDIQALRAVAVASVVLYHLWPERLRGGFVGVDVFFVISGFLITQHLADEITRTGRIALTQFWARRIRRLLPASFAVLTVSLAVLLLLMPRVTWQVNLQEIGASAAYVENWILGRNAVDYLAAHNSASLVQHYWSLSVEEQFYLVWPLLLLLAVAATRLLRRTAPRTAVRWALVVVALGSFAVSIVLTRSDAALAFFVTPTRAWEFAVGGLVALAPPVALGSRGPAVRAAAGWAGLAVIAFSVVFITGATPFPGWIAAVPVAGAALVLAGGTQPVRWSTAPLATLPGVQWLGNYSYSVYLWHWPLIVAAPWVLHGPPSWVAKLVMLVASLGLAYLTKRFVEDPVRTGRRWRVRRWPSYAFAAAGMVVFLVITTIAYGNVQKENDAQAAAALAKIVDHAPCYGAEAIVDSETCARPFARPPGLDTAFAASDLDAAADACQQHLTVPTLKFCTFGQKVDPTRTVVVVGNSHAVRLIPALDLYGREHGWKIILAGKTGCLGLITTPVGGQAADDSCVLWSAQLQKALFAMPQVDAVVFSSYVLAQLYLVGPDATPADVATGRQRIVATWAAYRKHGIPVVVTEDVPGMRPDAGPECIAKTTVDYDPCALPRSSVVKPNLLSTLARANPELVTYVPMSQYFCDATTCHSLIGGVVVYSDSHHMTTTFSRSLAQYLGPAVTAVLKN